MRRETVKTTRTPLAAHVEKPLPGQPLMHADVEVSGDTLLVWLRLVGTCGLRQDVRVTERRLMKIRASEGRPVPVVLLLIAAGVVGPLAATQKRSGFGWLAGAYTGGAVLYSSVPLRRSARRLTSSRASSHLRRARSGRSPTYV